VVLLGDSTIDNVVWVQDPETAVAPQLQRCLSAEDSTQNHRVVNWAADGWTSEDVLKGALPCISFSARQRCGDPFPVREGSPTDCPSHFDPLGMLEEARGSAGSDTTIVLSVGGNDVRHILRDMSSISTVMKDLVANYRQILERLLVVAPGRVAIMTQYRPALDEDGVYGVYRAMSSLQHIMPDVMGPDPLENIGRLMRMVYAPVVAMAQERGVPVIDVANTFDPKDAALYEHQIEPSGVGAGIIARLIAHVVKAHPWQEGKCRYYHIPKSADGKGYMAPAELRFEEDWHIRMA